MENSAHNIRVNTLAPGWTETWLCSAAASYAFGQMLVVDGGMTIGGLAFD